MRIKNKLSVVLLFLLGISMVSATIYVVTNQEKTQVVAFQSDEVGWNHGFRSVSEINTCKSNKEVINPEALMQCYGFKELQ